MILSKAEQEFLRAPEAFNTNYQKVLKSRVKSKLAALREELTLLTNAGLLATQNCNSVTEIRNQERNQKSSNQAAFQEQRTWLVRSPGFEPGITSLEGLCPKPD